MIRSPAGAPVKARLFGAAWVAEAGPTGAGADGAARAAARVAGRADADTTGADGVGEVTVEDDVAVVELEDAVVELDEPVVELDAPVVELDEPVLELEEATTSAVTVMVSVSDWPAGGA